MISEELYINTTARKITNTEILIVFFSENFHTRSPLCARHRNATDATLEVHLGTGGRLVCGPERPTVILVAA